MLAREQRYSAPTPTQMPGSSPAAVLGTPSTRSISRAVAHPRHQRLRPQNTARFRLAGAVPAKVLADMLDFSVATFENYARLAGGTRGDYPALREQRQIAHPKLRR